MASVQPDVTMTSFSGSTTRPVSSRNLEAIVELSYRVGRVHVHTVFTVFDGLDGRFFGEIRTVRLYVKKMGEEKDLKLNCLSIIRLTPCAWTWHEQSSNKSKKKTL